MDFTLKKFSARSLPKTACLVVPVTSSTRLGQAAKAIDQLCEGRILRSLKRGDIKGETGDSLLLVDTGSKQCERILLVGYGNGKQLKEKQYRELISNTAATLKKMAIKEACLLMADLEVNQRDSHWLLQQAGSLFETNCYQYRKTLSKPAAAPALKKLTLLANNRNQQALTALARGQATGRGINTARELGNLPGNICTPSYLAKQARSLAKQHSKLRTSIVEEKKMRELGMGSLLSVTAGTDQPAKLIVMNYQGAAKSSAPQVLVGKGITFDSGGISLKPGAKMDEMKYDMCGAASVFGTVQAAAELQLPINLIGVVVAAENLPSGSATKPGDVVTSMSGQTIEILNTDAEGRLVLCDALTYVERFKPAAVIDIATLTGACVVALGSHVSGLYSNQQAFADELLEAGVQSWDRAWQMPLLDEYQEQLKSNFADMANIGGPEAGSVTAACFLARFADAYRWAHLDIAGTAWQSGANKGGSGRPVSLLTQYLFNQADQA